MCVELLTPGGNWSSYPPHRHDDSPECPVNNEEIYYFRIGRDGTTAYAPERLRAPPHVHARRRRRRRPRRRRRRRVPRPPRLPRARASPPPGYPLYYLNVLAGPGGERSMAFCDDPAHHWVRDSWIGDGADPRCPMTTAAGRGAGVTTAAASASGSSASAGWARPTAARTGASRPCSPTASPTPCSWCAPTPSPSAGAERPSTASGSPRPPTTGASVVEHPDVDVVVVDRAEHAARRDRVGRRRGRQGGVLREARRRDAGPDRRGRAGGPPRRHRRRVQLPLGAARAVRQVARSTAAGSGTITNYRGRFLSCYGNDPLGLLSLAVPRRPGRPRRQHRPAQPRRRPGPPPRRADHRGRRRRRDVHPRSGRCPAGGGTHYDRGAAGDPTGAVTNEDWFGAIVRFAGGADRARSRPRGR